MTRARDKWNARIPPTQLHLVNEFAQALYLDRKADIAESIAQTTPKPDLEMTLNLIAASTWTATAQYRNELLKNFDSPALRIYGDDNWPQIMPNSQFMGPVNYGEDLSQVYEASTINLNATSLQMQTAVNQRVFDVPASGGLIITDAQADAMEHFEPGAEIVTYKCAEELKDKSRPDKKTACRRLLSCRA